MRASKGREEPVDAWVAEEALLPPGARPGRGITPLVGRDSELALLNQLATERGLGLGKIAQPLRVALTGGTVSPPIDATVALHPSLAEELVMMREKTYSRSPE